MRGLPISDISRISALIVERAKTAKINAPRTMIMLEPESKATFRLIDQLSIGDVALSGLLLQLFLLTVKKMLAKFQALPSIMAHPLRLAI